MKKKQKQRLFYLAYALYMTATLLQSTMFVEYEILAKGFAVMRYAAFALGAVKVGADFWGQRPTVWQWARYSVIVLLLLAVAWKSGDRSLLFVFMLLLAAKDMEPDRVLRRTFALQIAVMAIPLIGSSVGVIPDLLFKREQIPIRHALGYTYPSVMVTSCFFILLLYVWNKNKPLSWQEFLVIEALNFFIYKLTDSRTGFLLIAFAALIVWGVGVKWKRWGRRRQKSRFWNVRAVFYDFFPVWLSLFLLLLCVTLPWGVTQWINRFLTNRIQLIVNAAAEYGIRAFGSHIEWVGFGGSVDTDRLLASYNFVDSSYGFILINYGWLVFLLVISAFVWGCHRVRTRESGIRQFVFWMVLVYCFIEPRLLELQVNAFLLLLSPLLTGPFLTGPSAKRRNAGAET